MKRIQTFIQFITPSWVVSLIGVTMGIFLLAGVIGVVQYTSSELKPQIESARQDDTTLQTANDLFANFSGRLADNELLNTAPLFLTWAAVGLAIYFCAVAIVKAFSEAEALRQELGYMNTSRRALLREAAGRFAVRAAAIAGWFLFIELTWRIIVPYAVSLSSIIITGINITGVICAVAAVAVIYGAVCGHAIFLRLVLLRSRVFG